MKSFVGYIGSIKKFFESQNVQNEKYKEFDVVFENISTNLSTDESEERQTTKITKIQIITLLIILIGTCCYMRYVRYRDEYRHKHFAEFYDIETEDSQESFIKNRIVSQDKKEDSNSEKSNDIDIMNLKTIDINDKKEEKLQNNLDEKQIINEEQSQNIIINNEQSQNNINNEQKSNTLNNVVITHNESVSIESESDEKKMI